MTDKQLEATVWCPSCKLEKGRVFRVPAGNEGIYENVTEPRNLPESCDCGTNLERKR